MNPQPKWFDRQLEAAADWFIERYVAQFSDSKATSLSSGWLSFGGAVSDFIRQSGLPSVVLARHHPLVMEIRAYLMEHFRKEPALPIEGEPNLRSTDIAPALVGRVILDLATRNDELFNAASIHAIAVADKLSNSADPGIRLYSNGELLAEGKPLRYSGKPALPPIITYEDLQVTARNAMPERIYRIDQGAEGTAESCLRLILCDREVLLSNGAEITGRARPGDILTMDDDWKHLCAYDPHKMRGRNKRWIYPEGHDKAGEEQPLEALYAELRRFGPKLSEICFIQGQKI